MKVQSLLPPSALYSRDIYRVSPKNEDGDLRELTDEEERDFAKRIAEEGTDGFHARNELIEANLRVIIKAVDRALIPFQCLRDEGLIDNNFVDDLIQDSNLALLEAAPDFDPNKGKFSTFAYAVARNVVKNSIHDKVSPIRISRHVWEKIAKLEAAEATEFSSAQINNAVNAYRLVRTIGIDEQIKEDANVGDLVVDEKSQDPEKEACNNELINDVRLYVNHLPHNQVHGSHGADKACHLDPNPTEDRKSVV